MGVFDDAIREHLELKRHAGADEEELKELEDEAFGPPARPGEPDFPGSTSEEEAVESDAPAASGVFDAETTEAEASETAAAESPEPVAEAPSQEEPALAPAEDESSELDQEPVEPASEELEAADEPEAAEPPAEGPGGEVGEASSFTTAEREAIADQPTVFFEQQPPEEFELGELELDIDEEIEEVGGAVSEPLTEEEPLAVEEAFAEPASETEVAEPPHETEPEPAAEPEPASEPEAAEPATGDEDVLEETPEFLRDNPDDDELWFEQGEPKDFDF
jgi:hypothetical protein